MRRLFFSKKFWSFRTASPAKLLILVWAFTLKLRYTDRVVHKWGARRFLHLLKSFAPYFFSQMNTFCLVLSLKSGQFCPLYTLGDAPPTSKVVETPDTVHVNWVNYLIWGLHFNIMQRCNTQWQGYMALKFTNWEPFRFPCVPLILLHTTA